MAGATAPVDGSGSLPAWMARVENPGRLRFGIRNHFTTEIQSTEKKGILFGIIPLTNPPARSTLGVSQGVTAYERADPGADALFPELQEVRQQRTHDSR